MHPDANLLSKINKLVDDHSIRKLLGALRRAAGGRARRACGSGFSAAAPSRATTADVDAARVDALLRLAGVLLGAKLGILSACKLLCVVVVVVGARRAIRAVRELGGDRAVVHLRERRRYARAPREPIDAATVIVQTPFGLGA